MDGCAWSATTSTPVSRGCSPGCTVATRRAADRCTRRDPGTEDRVGDCAGPGAADRGPWRTTRTAHRRCRSRRDRRRAGRARRRLLPAPGQGRLRHPRRAEPARGAWRHGWDRCSCSPPAQYSPLPGWRMPDQPGEPFPTAGHVRDYLAAYETRYHLPVRRNVDVDAATPGPISRSDPRPDLASPRGNQRDRDLASTALAPLSRGEHFRRARSTPCPTPARPVHRPAGRGRRRRELRCADPGGGLDRRRHDLGYLRGRRGSCPTTSTGGYCSTSPPDAPLALRAAAPTPAGSPGSATSSWSPRSAPPGTAVS